MTIRITTLAIDYGGTLATGSADDPKTGRPVDADAAVALHQLHEAGYRLVLSSNTPGRSRRPALAAAGVERLFTAVVESHQLGHAKPSRAFYNAIVEAAGNCRPDQIVHIGNRLDADVLVPVAVGMRAVYVEPHQRRRARLPQGAARIAHFASLPKLLISWP
jgi:putative hydrolase of the HAD superfamily